MKKLVALCLACMLALLYAGGLAEVSKDGLPVSEEKITLTGLVSSDTKVGDWNENPTVKLFEERTNIHVDWESVPAAGFAEKRNLLFASNELPDIIMRAGLSSSLEAKYAANGQLLALDELLDYAPNLRALMEHSAPGIVDLCLANSAPLSRELLERYREEDAAPICVDQEEIRKLGVELVERPLITKDCLLARHASDLLARAVMELYGARAMRIFNQEDEYIIEET